FVRRVETEETQMAGQPAEMHISEEPWLAQRLGPYGRDRPDVERLEHRVNGDSIAIVYAGREIDGLAVDDYQIDFGMRNARCFDQVLDRRLSIEEALDSHEALPSRQEVIQLGVETKLDSFRSCPAVLITHHGSSHDRS